MKLSFCVIDDMELFLLDRLQNNPSRLEVSVSGEITFNGKVLTHSLDQFGYPRVYWSDRGSRKGAFVHRLMAQEFISNPENKPFVNHIDGNKGNFAIANLEWVTPMENTEHAINSLPESSHPGRPVSTKERNINIFNDFKAGATRAELCEKWNLKRHSISLAIREAHL